jgi:antitoxin component YwqK of YwqJK toxin-antitoxin module
MSPSFLTNLHRLAAPLGMALLVLGSLSCCKPAVVAEAKPLELEQRDDGFTYVKGTTERYSGTFQILGKQGHLQSIQDYKNGLMHGKFVLFNADGSRRRQVDYVHGSMVRHLKWHDNGQLRSDERMREGAAYGLCQHWYPDGKIQKLISLTDNGLLHGHFLEYDEAGVLVTDAIMVNGKHIEGIKQPKPAENEMALNSSSAKSGADPVGTAK